LHFTGLIKIWDYFMRGGRTPPTLLCTYTI
jgi:hypothetical protein